MKNQIVTSVVMAAAAVVLSASKVKAQFQSSSANTLAALEAGASLTVGDKTFGNFEFNSSSVPPSSSFDPAAITVTASAIGNVDYLTWTTPDINAFANVLTDISIDYTVTASAGLITEMDQQVTGNVFGGTGNATISDAVTDAHSNPIATISVAFPGSTNGSSSFAGQAELDVAQDIFLGGGSAGAGISQLQESFQQSPLTVPDGGMTLILLGGVMSAMALMIKASPKSG
jgi:hypothetical protein